MVVAAGVLPKFNRSSQHRTKRGCDDDTKKAVGTGRTDFQIIESSRVIQTIRIGAPFRLSDGTTTSMIKPNEPASAGRAAVLVRKEVARAMALAEGTLDIRFSDGAFVSVTPDPDYEAWTMTASNGLRLVSLPGGTLAIWDPPTSGGSPEA